MPKPDPWIHEKNRLAKKFPWIPILLEAPEEPIVDAITFETVKDLENGPIIYDPYQIESLLSSASTRLDRCLVYRREMNELEEQAVRSALEYELFGKQLEPQRSIELAEHVVKQREVEKKGQETATTAFTRSRNALGPGFAAIADASAKSSQCAIDGEKSRRANVLKKWVALEEYQFALEARHSTPGHALNYRDRFKAIRGHFEQELKIAYNKARCISLGTQRIYEIASHLQSPTKSGYLDYLVTYVRSTLEQIELKTLEETDFEHIVTIRQPRVQVPDLSKVVRHKTDAEWNHKLDLTPQGDGRIVIDLTNEFPATIKRLRVRGITASMLADNSWDARPRQRTTSVVVFPPAPAGWSGDPKDPNNKLAFRPPIILERVGPTDQRPPPARHVSINNLDPRGTWEIQISANMLWPDAGSHGRRFENIFDIRLHLDLSAVVENSPKSTDWMHFYF